LRALNGFFERDLLVRRLALDKRGSRLTLVSVGDRLESALGEIAGCFAETVVRGDRSRIKICVNKDCLWVFYDRSKNKSRKWCEEATCGNLMKVRRFRERHRGKSRPH
jgi:predicted RNA-binding Zn ribbon-like protein